jgi:hypothetical protein
MYRKSLFCFLDILGFSQMVGTESAGSIKGILDVLRKHAQPSPNIHKMLEMSFLTFSDCTIRSTPIRSKSNRRAPTGLLWNELMSLMFAQVGLISEGYFLRGALTIGKICARKTRVFGPALVRAHSLESEFAIYPRIVIDPVVFEEYESEPLLRNEIHDLETEKKYIARLVRRDSDGLYFLDYLRACLSEFNEEGQELLFLLDHKRLIVKNGARLDGLNKIAAKYLWLATYHNRTVRRLPSDYLEKFGQSLDGLLISKRDLPYMPELWPQTELTSEC